MNYNDTYQNSIDNKVAFWREQAEQIDWYKSPETILSKNQEDYYQWFSGGKMNTSYLALDYHIANGRGDQTALIYDSPVTKTVRSYTYNDLKSQVAKLAYVLDQRGVKKGDRVLIYMPMIPQAAIAMLACARIGAIHSVVFGGFAAHELAVRIEDAKPVAVISASCGIEVETIVPYKNMLDEALEESTHKVLCCLVYQREECFAQMTKGRDYDWHRLMSDANEMDPVIVDATDPLYILYTSGTTGKPKGVVRDNGGHAVAMNYSMKTIYGMEPGDVFWAASDVGWVVGHSYIVYAPLIAGCTTILFEGKPIKTPNAGVFWRVCEQHKIKALFSAPTAFRAICKEDPEGKYLKEYDLSSLERLYLAGERLDPATYHWLKDHSGLPVIDHWWQTETGWAIAGIPVGIEMLETKPGSAGVSSPGYDVQILDEKGQQVEAEEQGSVAIKLPLPPGTLQTIWQNLPRFQAGYLNTYKGYYLTGDGGYIDKDGYLYIMGRTDDVINVAGHRLSTGEMEEVIADHRYVAECAVVGIQDELKGQMPYGLVVLKNGISVSQDQIQVEVKQMIREKIGAIASLKQVMVVERLPKTRSGKILRKTIRQMIDGEDLQIPSTIDDVSILDELSAQLLAKAG